MMNETKKNGVKDKAFWVIFSLLVISMGYMVSIAAWPYKPVRVDSIIIDKEEAKRGDEVCFQFYGEKFYDIPTEITVELVNGERFEVAKYTSCTTPGVTFKPRCFIVPSNINIDSYRVQWTGVNYMNALNKVTTKGFSDNWIKIKGGK
jgi:hypothetical protein